MFGEPEPQGIADRRVSNELPPVWRRLTFELCTREMLTHPSGVDDAEFRYPVTLALQS
jgi:hypothetical protein